MDEPYDDFNVNDPHFGNLDAELSNIDNSSLDADLAALKELDPSVAASMINSPSRSGRVSVLDRNSELAHGILPEMNFEFDPITDNEEPVVNKKRESTRKNSAMMSEIEQLRMRLKNLESTAGRPASRASSLPNTIEKEKDTVSKTAHMSNGKSAAVANTNTNKNKNKSSNNNNNKNTQARGSATGGGEKKTNAAVDFHNSSNSDSSKENANNQSTSSLDSSNGSGSGRKKKKKPLKPRHFTWSVNAGKRQDEHDDDGTQQRQQQQKKTASSNPAEKKKTSKEKYQVQNNSDDGDDAPGQEQEVVNKAMNAMNMDDDEEADKRSDTMEYDEYSNVYDDDAEVLGYLEREAGDPQQSPMFQKRPFTYRTDEDDDSDESDMYSDDQSRSISPSRQNSYNNMNYDAQPAFSYNTVDSPMTKARKLEHAKRKKAAKEARAQGQGETQRSPHEEGIDPLDPTGVWAYDAENHEGTCVANMKKCSIM